MKPADTNRVWLCRRTGARDALIRATALVVACCLLAWQIAAQDPRPTEYQVKAAYLTNLGRFVEKWSTLAAPSPGETFEICVLGQDPFEQSLDLAVRDENIGGAPLTVKRIARPQDTAGCRVLFISASEGDQLGAIMATLGPEPVLTVSDIPGFVDLGGMIQFILDGNRVRFEINIAAARRAGLTLSSELLKLARAVKRAP